MQDLQLIKLDQARQLLADASTIKEVKKIIDMAELAEIYAKKVHLGEEAEMYARAIKLEAQRKAGEFLSETIQHGGDQSKSSGTTLTKIGITRDQSSKWQELAELPVEDFEKIKIGKRSVKGALKELKREKKRKNLKTNAVLPEAKFDVIYADPPWRYSNSGLNGSAEDQYPTMALEDIKNMPINTLCNKNMVLFIWVTNPLLKESFEVIEAWGFEYKTNIVWVKNKQTGIGFYAYGKHELLLICTKGSMLPLTDYKPCSVIESPRIRHSQKPSEVYEIIEKMYPDTKKIELFARNKRKNWHSYGNEV